MAKHRRRRAGRPRQAAGKMGAERQPDGRVRPERREIAPWEVLRKRAEAAGLDPEALVSVSSVAALRLCQDQSAGTALGRLTWHHLPMGERKRRMLEDGETPLISDAMVQAADAYRAAWVGWHRASGLPARHPRTADPSGVPGGDCGDDSPSAEQAAKRLKLAEQAMRACHAPLLVRAVIDSVVIENEAGLLQERPTALAALRAGLQAIAEALVLGRRKVA